MESNKDISIFDYSFEPIDERMYLICQGKDALVVDPNRNQIALNKLKENSVENVFILLTHEHYDHIFGVNLYREEFSHVEVLASQKCSGLITDSSMNLSNYWYVLFDSPKVKHHYDMEANVLGFGPYKCSADITFENEYETSWQGHKLKMKETPGHSPGSICIVMDDKYLFSGDSLVTGHPPITRLPGGSKKDYRNTTLPWLKSLDSNILVLPGHGDRQLLGDYWKEAYYK